MAINHIAIFTKKYFNYCRMTVDDYSIEGKIRFQAQEYSEAIENFKKALEMIRKQKNVKPIKYYLITNALGFAYEENQQYQDALDCYQESLEFMKVKYGPEAIETMSSLQKIKNCKNKLA
jgi:tetratricopeptide (TPR) repeat protein